MRNIRPMFKKFEVVLLNWGYNTKCIRNSDQQTYTKDEILGYTSINFENEFSDIDGSCNLNRHMGVIVSSYFFNKNSNTVLVAPITSMIDGRDQVQHQNKFFLYKEHYSGLRQDSIVLLNKIKEIDKNRILKHLFFIREAHHSAFNERLKKVFGL